MNTVQESKPLSDDVLMMGPDGAVYLISSGGQAVSPVPVDLAGEPAVVSADANPYKAIEDSLAFLPPQMAIGRLC